jgi:lipocalin
MPVWLESNGLEKGKAMEKRAVHLVLIGLLVALGVSSMVSCVSSRSTNDPLETVETLDLEKYLGRWYEVARYQHPFEKTLVGATAEYTLREDGKVQVVNSGFKKTLDGKYSDVKAVAWRPDETQPGKLKVKFFGLITSDYLVFALDEVDYQWALVGQDSRDFLWFLSRTPQVSDELLEKMKAMASAQGYDLTDLFLVPQKAR